MDAKHWSRVERLFHAALERDPEHRAAFLSQACSGDDGLRREVESLLAQRGSTEGLIDPSAWAEETGLAETATMLASGARLGPYEILRLLGAGGMGQVYRAVDTRLGRHVAIKTSARRFSGRFEREARAIAALNHPHVCTLYDVGPNYLIMELVEGETLSARLTKGPLPVDLVQQYGTQIAEALAAAHAFGIVHRDLKPGNIMVTQTGIKVLDFGLAKFTDSAEAAPKRAETLTAERAVVGTPAYMAPEQLSGEEVDARTDLFSLGAVLYEMATGRRAFPRDLDRTPPPPAKTDPRLRRIIVRLLELDRSSRYQTASDVLDELQRLQRAPAAPRRWVTLGLATAAIVAVVAALMWPRAPLKPPDRSDWVQITNFPDSVSQPALSPDGRVLAFIRGIGTFYTEGQVYLKTLPDGQPMMVTHDDSMKMGPVFSPDGSRVAYTTVSKDFKWDTWTVPVRGGEPMPWLLNASGLVWAGLGRLLFSQIETGQHMAIVTAAETRAESRVVYTPPTTRGMAHRSYLSPDGKSVLLVEMDGAWAPCRVVPFDGSSTGRQVGPPSVACTNAAWAPDGKWIYVSALTEGNFHIWRQRFPQGRPEQLTSGPAEEEGIAVSADGRYLITASGLRERTVSLHDARGERQISTEGYAYRPRLSNDGKKLYYRVLRGNSPTGAAARSPGELWAADTSSGRTRAILPGFEITDYDISSDGLRVVFSALDATGKARLWIASADGSSRPRALPDIEGDTPFFGPATELFFRANESSYSFAFRVREDGTGRRKLISEPVNSIHGVSPDGHWVVGTSPDAVEGGTEALTAYPVSGGSPVRILGHDAVVRWSPDMRDWALGLGSAGMEGGSAGKTYVFRLPPGRALPDLPPGGFHSEADIAAFPGVRVLNSADISLGTAPEIYAYSVGTTRRNLFRIPLP